MNRITSNSEGLGQTGQAYIIGTDAHLRTEMRRTNAPQSLYKVDVSPEFLAAVDGPPTDLRLETGSNSCIVQTLAEGLTFKNIRWALVMGQERSEAMPLITRLRNQILLQLTVLAIFITIRGGLIVRTSLGNGRSFHSGPCRR